MTFSGSYECDDVQFLLKPVEMQSTDVAKKERLIQSGARHYSELLTRESPPAPEYLHFFDNALQRHRRRMAYDIVSMARHLAARSTSTIVLVSLARAGTPVGVLLHRALSRLGRRSVHYSISIIRDRGLDRVAMDYILARHRDREIVFIDGWTGKGAIARELTSAVTDYNRARGTEVADSLYVLADPAGHAEYAVTGDDYLIPCALLNATVSGLISRTILNVEHVGADDFHACVYYREFAVIDRSRTFISEIMKEAEIAIEDPSQTSGGVAWSGDGRENLRRVSEDFVSTICRRYELGDRNRVKVGIGESTRALLRRAPSRILIHDPNDADVAHLRWLAAHRSIEVEIAPWLPYRATAIIQHLGSD